MESSYPILYRPGSAEETVKKSRFLACALPISSEEEAAAALERIRKEHWSANHHCYALTLGARQELTRSSDDREPSGTAGRPILEVLLGSGVRNALIVVTRWFGGVLLGTGGLVRAYGGAAKKALEAASVLTLYDGEEWKIRCDYTQLGAVQKLIRDEEYPLRDTEYGSGVVLDLCLSADRRDAFLSAVTDITQGRAVCERVRPLRFGLSGEKLIFPDDLPAAGV